MAKQIMQFRFYDEKKADRVLHLENEIDRYEDTLGSYLVKLAQKNMAEKEKLYSYQK